MLRRPRTSSGKPCLAPSYLAASFPALLLAILSLGGCGRPATPSAAETSSGAKTPVTAESVMATLIDVYHDARFYQDDAVVRLKYRREGQSYEDEAPLSVAWQAPNRLHVPAYQVEVRCDGGQFMARIHDEETRNFDHQIVLREAPEILSVDELWGKDEILSLAFRQGLAGYPIQLDLLRSDTPRATVSVTPT